MIQIRDLVFKDANEAGAYLGISPKEILRHQRKGTLYNAGLGRCIHHTRTVYAEGTEFPSMTAFARHYGINHNYARSRIYKAVERGEYSTHFTVNDKRIYVTWKAKREY